MTAAARPHRVHAERLGRLGEWIALVLLVLRGYRILARRWRGGRNGELDIVATRGGRIAFVEVKLRRSLDTAETSVRPRQMQRLHRAADAFVARAPRYAQYQRGFDALFLAPWRFPRFASDHLQPAIARRAFTRS